MPRAAMALAGLVVMLSWPAFAQEPTPPPLTERAPVVLDGHVLFEVGEAGTWSAAQRAAGISAALRAAAIGGEPVHLELAEHDGYPTLRMGAWHLLTVADSDVPMGMDAGEQAQRWQQVVETALLRAAAERAPAHLTIAALHIGAALLLAALAHALIGFARRRLPPRLARAFGWAVRAPGGGPPGWQSALTLSALVLQTAVWSVALWWSADRLPATRQARWSFVHLLRTSLDAPLFALGERNVSTLDVLWLVGAIALLSLAVSVVTRFVSQRLMRATGAPDGALQPVATLIRYGLIFVGTLVILQSFGLNLSSLALLASVLGVGIGFGLQSIANNFVSGLIISFEQPVKPGDFVTLGTLQGTVLRIGARSTVVQTLDRVSIIVPNSKLLETEVVNWSYSDPVSRLHIPIGVAYGSDIEAVRSALLTAAQAHPGVLTEPRPEVRFDGFGDSALNFELLVWSRDPPGQSLLRSDLNYQLEANLRRFGIEVPFPQRTLHLPAGEIDALAARLRGEPPLAPAAPEATPAAAAPVAPVTPWHAVELQRLTSEMRGPDGVERRDRRHRFSVYRCCFVGVEAVDWLTRAYDLSREEAVRLGQSLLERGVIHHVLDEHPFRDGNFFYRFYADDEAGDEPLAPQPAAD